MWNLWEIWENSWKNEKLLTMEDISNLSNFGIPNGLIPLGLVFDPNFIYETKLPPLIK